jgi:hypothetical protein
MVILSRQQLCKRLFKMGYAGSVSTFAGRPNSVSTSHSSNDDHAAVGSDNNGVGTNIRFYGPMAVAADATGRVYVVEFDSNDVKLLTSDGSLALYNFLVVIYCNVGGYTGIMSTFAGSLGGSRYHSSPVDGVGTSALFRRPDSATVDKTGNLYIGESDGRAVRRITSSGNVLLLSYSGLL